MGNLSSAAGFALVVPAFYVCAGILLYTAIVATVMGLYRARAPLYLAYAATCLASACVTFGVASYYVADSVDGAVRAFHGVTVAAAVLICSMFVFVALYTKARRMRRWYWAAGVTAGALVALDLAMPFGLRFSSVDSMGWVHLPWGESLFQIEGEATWGQHALRALSVVVIVWSVWRLLVIYRDGKRRDALVLAFYLLVLFATSLQGLMIERGVIRTFHWIPIGLTGLAFLMGLNLLLRMREQTEALSTAARTDELTGLPNRRAVRERLERRFGRGAAGLHGALLECDLDHFKVVNDALGQEVGDALLREVAVRLAACVDGKAMVARVGGNAFMLVSDTLYRTEREAANAIEVLARMASAALSAPFHVGERTLGVAASVGIVTFETGTAASDLTARADLALGLAKRRGGNYIQPFAPHMQDEAAKRYRIVEGLRHAIGRNELELRFQPVVDAAGRAIGAEALLRWRSAELGEVSPGIFIPIAEETGLIHTLGEWTLTAACERIATWRRERGGFPGYVAVNVSPWQLAHPGFVARLREVLALQRIQPGELTLEVTESAVLADKAEAIAKLDEIRSLGVKVALDDFGTGYSSLALVKDLPLDLIKIDQSFVRALDKGANRHLVRVVVTVGTELGLQVVAEGVETAAERDALLELGCTRFQGFLFARPMPEEALLAWLSGRTLGPKSHIAETGPTGSLSA